MTLANIWTNFCYFILIPGLILFPLMWLAFYLGLKVGRLEGREEAEEEMTDRAVRMDGARERI